MRSAQSQCPFDCDEPPQNTKCFLAPTRSWELLICKFSLSKMSFIFQRRRLLRRLTRYCTMPNNSSYLALGQNYSFVVVVFQQKKINWKKMKLNTFGLWKSNSSWLSMTLPPQSFNWWVKRIIARIDLVRPRSDWLIHTTTRDCLVQTATDSMPTSSRGMINASLWMDSDSNVGIWLASGLSVSKRFVSSQK